MSEHGNHVDDAEKKVSPGVGEVSFFQFGKGEGMRERGEESSVEIGDMREFEESGEYWLRIRYK